MQKHACLALLTAALSAHCSSTSATFQQAEALEAQGKLEEAATNFDKVCAVDPKTPACADADAHAAKARLKASDEALTQGQYKKAKELLRTAQIGADEATAKDIDERLAKDDLKQGLLYESAAADPDKTIAFKTMEAIASTATPAAEKAKAWLTAERPAHLAQLVKAACGPRHEGSCSKTWAELQTLAGEKPPGFDEARAAAEAEEKRIYKARFEAERFLGVFAQRGQRQKAYEKCLKDKAAEIESEYERTTVCRGEAWETEAADRFLSEQNDDNLFRRRLTLIADPEIVASLEARKKEALETGTYTKVTVNKPAGGAK